MLQGLQWRTCRPRSLLAFVRHDRAAQRKYEKFTDGAFGDLSYLFVVPETIRVLVGFFTAYNWTSKRPRFIAGCFHPGAHVRGQMLSS